MARRTGYRVFLGIEEYTYDTKTGTSQKIVVDGNVLESTGAERVEGSAVHGDWTLNGHCKTLKEADALIASMVHIKPEFTGYPCGCMTTEHQRRQMIKAAKIRGQFK
jgi:hypothetical protein